MDRKLTKEEYLEILKRKRSKEISEYSDLVLYKGKTMKRCPPNTAKSGNTCIPKAPTMGVGGYKQKDLGGISPTQARLLSQAKSSKDISKARKSI